MAESKRAGRPITRHRVRVARSFVGGLVAIGAVAAVAGQLGPAHAQQPDSSSSTAAEHDSSAVTRELHADLDAYLRMQGQAEHVSAAGLSVSLPDRRSTIDVSAGTMRFGASRPVSTSSLWQIGSNTKAFTSVLLLQLEAEQRLSIHDTVGRWLPQYPQWRDITIKRLLNMTSGIPTYEEQPAFLTDYAADPHRYFSKQRLVNYAMPATPTTGYSYSNTGYTLAEMVIEKATRDSYEHQLYSRIIQPLGLHNLYYRPHLYPDWVTAREPAGYFFVAPPPPPFAGMVGRDVSRDTLSWTRGAGGILATTHDMTVWERALYGGHLLPASQQAELMSLVSETTGHPIKETSPSDPAGFGLGVQQVINSGLGTIWTYEGGTFGFRTLHMYVPSSGVIIAVGLNSQSTQDEIGALVVSVYGTLLSHGTIHATPAPSAGGAGTVAAVAP